MEYFRINTVEELKQAYEQLKWNSNYSLKQEMDIFRKDNQYRIIKKRRSGMHYLVKEHFLTELDTEIPSPLKSSSKHSHYDNRSGSLYEFANDKSLNAWEFDIIKRIVRCRKKGQFLSDLQKTKDVIDLYIKEYNNETD